MGIDLEDTGETSLTRAIVKEFVLLSIGYRITNRNLKSILGKLCRLNKMRIYTLDIRLDNFLNIKFVDFGIAVTEPYFLMDHFDNKNY